MKAGVDEPDIDILINVLSGFNNLKTKVNDLDVGKLKIVTVDLKRLSDLVSEEVVKTTKYNKLNLKVNNIENKVPDVSTLIHINQYNTDKQGLEKKMEVWIKRY